MTRRSTCFAAGANLAALQILFLLLRFRNNTSGVTSVGYTRMADYGVFRASIRYGLDVLVHTNMVHVFGDLEMPLNEHAKAQHYFVLGLNARVPAFTTMRDRQREDVAVSGL